MNGGKFLGSSVSSRTPSKPLWSARLGTSRPGRRWARLFLWTCALLLLAACRPSNREELQVAAAASLAQALPEVAQAFERENRVPVVLVFSSSGSLTQQIVNGATYDVFLSADEAHVDTLVARGYVEPATRRVYAVGFLVLVVANSEVTPIRRLDDLQRPEVERIAIANPVHAPYGRAAQEALRRAGIWEAVQPKIVMAENVRQALQFVQTGNAAAGLVAKSLLPAEGVVAYPVPPELYTPVHHTGAVVKAARHPEIAQRFLDFLVSKQGQAILQRHGFGAPPGNR